MEGTCTRDGNGACWRGGRDCSWCCWVGWEKPCWYMDCWNTGCCGGYWNRPTCSCWWPGFLSRSEYSWYRCTICKQSIWKAGHTEGSISCTASHIHCPHLSLAVGAFQVSRWVAIRSCNFLLSSDLADMAFSIVTVSDCFSCELLLFLFDDWFMGSFTGVSLLVPRDSSISSTSSSDTSCCWLGPGCSAVGCGWLIANFSFTYNHRTGKYGSVALLNTDTWRRHAIETFKCYWSL